MAKSDAFVKSFMEGKQATETPLKLIIKRDGRKVPFEQGKIAEAIFKAARSVGGEDKKLAEDLADVVTLFLKTKYTDSNPPHVEEVQNAVEKVLIETGHAKTAKAYILYREHRAKVRRFGSGLSDQVTREIEASLPSETTDLSLFVRTSSEEIIEWDRDKIVDALVRETGLSPRTAKVISMEVERQIILSKIRLITAPLIRELVDAKLIEYGLEETRRKHTRLGVPIFDAEQIISIPNKENANIPHNPEATNLMLAERIKKEFALLKVFSLDVADAHARGDLHLHDLGFIDRPYCSGQSLEYVKKFGLDLPNALSIARPAKHPETLLAHMIKFSATLQGHFAGAIGWDAVNIFFAPFLEDSSEREIRQIAQMLIFEYSQQAVARGGQAIFSDLNLYWEIPKHFEDVEAIGPGGVYTGRTYSDYRDISQRFLWQIFDVFKEGDACGRPFFFPKPLVHITEKFFQSPGHEEFLEHVCEVAALKGNPYFVFDRGETAKISECCRLSFKLDENDLKDAREPWRMRYCALQNVTLNLPRAAYEARGSDKRLFERLNELLELTVKAHHQKRDYIESLLNLGKHGPLALLSMKRDGSPYLRLDRATYLVGILGLNELVEAHTGHQLHESEASLDLGLRVVAHLNLACKRLSEREGMRFVLEQTPAESASYRLAKLDLKYFTNEAQKVIKGDFSRGEVYYTNSTQLNISAFLNPIDRVVGEGLFHDMIEAGALTHVWLGDAQPEAATLANFVKKAFFQSQNSQITFSPEFTSCNSCGQVARGLHEDCLLCGSKDVDGITRVTGYFSRTSGWNPGKRGELRDRARWASQTMALENLKALKRDDGFVHIYGVSKGPLHPDGCARCEQAKDVIGNKLRRPFKFYDVESPEGMAALARLQLVSMAEKNLPIIRINGQVFDVLGKAVKFIKGDRIQDTGDREQERLVP